MSRPAPRLQHIAFVATSSPEAREAYERLVKRYGNADPKNADVIVALGGDGLMLQTLHKFMNSGKPIYGMHRGTVGFLMNEFAETGLRQRRGRNGLIGVSAISDALIGMIGPCTERL